MEPHVSRETFIGGFSMYIAPGTSVRLLRNIPLDSTYNHTIYFGSRSAQTSYFSSMAKYSLNEYKVKASVIKALAVIRPYRPCVYHPFYGWYLFLQIENLFSAGDKHAMSKLLNIKNALCGGRKHEIYCA